MGLEPVLLKAVCRLHWNVHMCAQETLGGNKSTMDEAERDYSAAYLHSQVENILVSQKHEAKLCDFGSATTKVMNPSSAAEIAQAEEEIQVGCAAAKRGRGGGVRGAPVALFYRC